VLKKLMRTFTSVLPVSSDRQGQCKGCGACCKLPYVCPFLIEKPGQPGRCSIYRVRPLNCRKYPRTAAEHLTTTTCGMKFVSKR
jgi:hypothetical protein